MYKRIYNHIMSRSFSFTCSLVEYFFVRLSPKTKYFFYFALNSSFHFGFYYNKCVGISSVVYIALNTKQTTCSLIILYLLHRIFLDLLYIQTYFLHKAFTNNPYFVILAKLYIQNLGFPLLVIISSPKEIFLQNKIPNILE